MARKNPSPLSLPIARLRAHGYTVRTGEHHNPRGSHLFNRLHYVLTAPDGTVTEIDIPGHAYGQAVGRMSSILDAIEKGRFWLFDTVVECPAIIGHNYRLMMGTHETMTRFATEAAAQAAADKAAPAGVLKIRRTRG